MRSFATVRDTVLFTVPQLIPSAAAISGSVMSSKYLSMTAVRIRCGSRSSACRTTSAMSLPHAWSATAWSAVRRWGIPRAGGGHLTRGVLAVRGVPRIRGRPVDIVFAVYLQSRRPAVRAAVLDTDTDEVLGPTGPASLPFSRRL